MTKREFIKDTELLHAVKLRACRDWADSCDRSKVYDDAWLYHAYLAEQKRLDEGYAYANFVAQRA